MVLDIKFSLTKKYYGRWNGQMEVEDEEDGDELMQKNMLAVADRTGLHADCDNVLLAVGKYIIHGNFARTRI